MFPDTCFKWLHKNLDTQFVRFKTSHYTSLENIRKYKMFSIDFYVILFCTVSINLKFGCILHTVVFITNNMRIYALDVFYAPKDRSGSKSMLNWHEYTYHIQYNKPSSKTTSWDLHAYVWIETRKWKKYTIDTKKITINRRHMIHH